MMTKKVKIYMTQIMNKKIKMRINKEIKEIIEMNLKLFMWLRPNLV